MYGKLNVGTITYAGLNKVKVNNENIIDLDLGETLNLKSMPDTDTVIFQGIEGGGNNITQPVADETEGETSTDNEEVPTQPPQTIRVTPVQMKVNANDNTISLGIGQLNSFVPQFEDILKVGVSNTGYSTSENGVITSTQRKNGEIRIGHNLYQVANFEEYYTKGDVDGNFLKTTSDQVATKSNSSINIDTGEIRLFSNKLDFDSSYVKNPTTIKTVYGIKEVIANLVERIEALEGGTSSTGTA